MGKVLSHIGKQEKLCRLLVCKSSEAKLGSPSAGKRDRGNAQQKTSLDQTIQSLLAQKPTRESDNVHGLLLC
jgi:hypothetical protein